MMDILLISTIAVVLVIAAIMAGIFLLGVGGTTGFLLLKGGKKVASKVKDVGKDISAEISIASVIPVEIRRNLKAARQHSNQIMGLVEQCTPVQQQQLQSTIETVERLRAKLTTLEMHLKKLYSMRDLDAELKHTQVMYEKYQNELETAEGKEIRLLNDLADRKEKHLTILKDMKSFRRQIELKIRQNATVLNSTHAEVQFLMARGELDNSRFRRLNKDLKENSDNLMDLLNVMEAIDEQDYSDIDV